MASTSNLGVGQIILYDGTEKFDDVKVDANAVIYEGDFVGLNAGTGYARKLTAADTFLGLAVRECLNTGSGFDPNRSGTGAVGTTTVRVLTKGKIRKAVTDGAGSLVGTPADIGVTVAASSDRAVNTTTAGNSTIGKISNLDPSGDYVLALEATAERSI